MAGDRLGIQQLTLNIRTTLHTKIITDNHDRSPAATPNYSAVS